MYVKNKLQTVFLYSGYWNGGKCQLLIRSYIVFYFFINWIQRDGETLLISSAISIVCFFYQEGFFFYLYLKNKYYYKLSWEEIVYCHSKGGIYAKCHGTLEDGGWVRARAFVVEQQKNNSVLNVKKPLGPKELIFMCRFRLFNVDLLTLNINPSKALALFLSLCPPLPYLFLWRYNNLEQYVWPFFFLRRFSSHCYFTLIY
jgi:hypothetical protein